MASSEGSPEPNPDWNGSARDTLGWLWPAHVYLFAVLFVMVAFVSIVMVITITVLTPGRKKHFVKMVMLGAVIVLSLSRAVTLLVDPYLSNGNASLWWKFGYILVTGLGTASLTASLAILLYIITISTRLISKHRQVDLGRVVAATTTANFVFFITSNVITMLVKNGKIMLTICQIIFALWGLVVSLGFGVLTYQLRKNAHATFEQEKFNNKMIREGQKLRKLALILAVLSGTAALFFVLRITEAITGLKTEKYTATWLWWSLQTGLRTLEFINAVVLLLVFKKEASKAQKTEQNASFESQKLHTWKNTCNKSGIVSDTT